MLDLKGNNLSDIDGPTLFRLLDVVFLDDGIFKWRDYCLPVDTLKSLSDVCHVHGKIFTWKGLSLSGLNLEKIEVSTLAYLLEFSPQLQQLNMSNCNLSGSIIKELLIQCGKNKVVHKPDMLDLKGNDLSNIDGVSLFRLMNLNYVNHDTLNWHDYSLSIDNLNGFIDAYMHGNYRLLTWAMLSLSWLNLASIEVSKLACLLKFSPQLQNLDMRNCQLSGSIIKGLLNECDKNNVVLKRNMFNLKGNDLSNIDGVSLFRLVNLTYVDHDTFNWHDYSLSIDNLNGFIDAYMHGNYRLLTWKMLSLSQLNLYSIEGSKLACLLQFSPKLKKLDMRYCQLSGSIVKELLNECDKNNVVLKPGMLDLRENNLSDIDGVTLFRLVTLNSLNYYYTFEWHDYNLSIDNLHSLIDTCCEHGKILSWKWLNVSELDLSSFEMPELACLLKVSPKLNYVHMKDCHLSGDNVKDFLNECDKNKVALKPEMFDLKGNNLSDIDGVTLFKLVNLIRNENVLDNFEWQWHDYNLSNYNLQSLLDTCCERGEVLTWKRLNISEVDLSSLGAKKIACLLQFSPQLNHLDMKNCQISGSIFSNLLNECDKNKVALKTEMFDLKGNNLSDIDVSFSCLVNIINCVDSTFKWCEYSLVDKLICLADACYENGRLLKWEKVNLSGIRLSSIGINRLACLIKSSPQLLHLDISDCHLSGSILKELLNECDKNNVVFKPGMLNLKGNDLSDADCILLFRLVNLVTSKWFPAFKWSDYNLSVDQLIILTDYCYEHSWILYWTNLNLSGLDLSLFEVSKLVCLFKLSPELRFLNMRNCSISGSIIKDVLNECDKNNVILKPRMLVLNENNLSGIDIDVCFRLVNLICVVFEWHGNNLSIDNLKSLVDSCYEQGRMLTWNVLDLSGCNLASIEGSTLACLLKLSPKLQLLVMTDCHLSSSIFKELLIECDKNNVLLKHDMLRIKENDLSDIDGVTLLRLVHLTFSKYYKYNFEWHDYSLSGDNLRDLVDTCNKYGRNLTWKRLNLSGCNLASIEGSTLACLLKFSPQLERLNLSNCNLSGGIILYVLNECERNGVVLKSNMLNLIGNNLSDITDEISVAKIKWVQSNDES